MLSFLKPRRSADPVHALYGAIVAEARRPALFAECRVPDTTIGRFEMIALHVFLVLRRLKSGSAATKELGQRLFDYFFADMDRSLRELGVGDLSVGKKVKGLAKSFYGRAVAYDRALDADDQAALAEALNRNIADPDQAEPLEAARLADYVAGQDRALADHPVERIAAGDPGFLSDLAAGSPPS